MRPSEEIRVAKSHNIARLELEVWIFHGLIMKVTVWGWLFYFSSGF